MTTKLPKELQEKNADKITALQELYLKYNYSLKDNAELYNALLKVITCSHYVYDVLVKFPQAFIKTFKHNEWFQIYAKNTYHAKLLKLFSEIQDENELMLKIRLFRHLEMARIAFRDISNLATLQETVFDLTQFSDQVIILTLKKLHEWMIKDFGQPKDSQNNPLELCVIAMGKLGAKELNFSSDIDLIFCYGEDGVSDHISYHEFFSQISQRLVKVLHAITDMGFVFRIDMRLRPFGSSGPLVITKNTLQEYYQKQGRDWERYACTRARIITGDTETQNFIQNTIYEFVYRRYIDFSIIEALRQLKLLILRESSGLQNDIKRGEGGIREIEFIVQTQQLIRGGKELWLQETSILELLPKLAQKQVLSHEEAFTLLDAYIFLRTLEHRLQEYSDRQTHQLPRNEHDQFILAYSMNFKDWDELLDEIIKNRSIVQKYFDATIAKAKITFEIICDVSEIEDLQLIQEKFDDQTSIAVCQRLGLQHADNAWKVIETFLQSDVYKNAGENNKKHTQLLLTRLLRVITKTQNHLETLKRILNLLEKIIHQANHLIMLLENPDANTHLCELFSKSLWISEQVSVHSFLLEELLDSKSLYTPYTLVRIDDELRQFLLAVPEDDIEQQMEFLRRFKSIQVLRVAAADLKGILPLMKVSDHLTFTASVILSYIKYLAWNYLVTRHGRPSADLPLTLDDFAIIGYGKLGGIELGYRSDLDIVFLHTDVVLDHMTDGADPITNGEFFIRLAQKIIHMLSANTSAGVLYAVDTRLRPSGNSGLLVSNISSFANYQKNEAWTWEHQALVRARIISGGEILQKQFLAIRHEILSQHRDSKKLKEEVVQMRSRMRDAQEKKSKGFFDVAHGKGGIKDIEFIVQYLTLNNSHEYPELMEYTDNIRILESIGMVGLLKMEEVELLSDAYRAFRKLVHHAHLQSITALIPIHDSRLENTFREEVIKIWDEIFS